METSVFLSAIFKFFRHILHFLRLLGLGFAFPTIDYYCYSIIYSGDSEAQTQQTQKCKIWRKKMKKALRKTLVSIFSTQFFQNQNIWATPLVSQRTENPKLHQWDTIV